MRSLQVKFSVLVVVVLLLACMGLAGIAIQHERRALVAFTGIFERLRGHDHD